VSGSRASFTRPCLPRTARSHARAHDLTRQTAANSETEPIRNECCYVDVSSEGIGWQGGSFRCSSPPSRRRARGRYAPRRGRPASAQLLTCRTSPAGVGQQPCYAGATTAMSAIARVYRSCTRHDPGAVCSTGDLAFCYDLVTTWDPRECWIPVPIAAPDFLKDIKWLKDALRGVFCFPAPDPKAGEAGGKQQKAQRSGCRVAFGIDAGAKPWFSSRKTDLSATWLTSGRRHSLGNIAVPRRPMRSAFSFLGCLREVASVFVQRPPERTRKQKGVAPPDPARTRAPGRQGKPRRQILCTTCPVLP
jgi:hypothetical protein